MRHVLVASLAILVAAPSWGDERPEVQVLDLLGTQSPGVGNTRHSCALASEARRLGAAPTAAGNECTLFEKPAWRTHAVVPPDEEPSPHPSRDDRDFRESQQRRIETFERMKEENISLRGVSQKDPPPASYADEVDDLQSTGLVVEQLLDLLSRVQPQ